MSNKPPKVPEALRDAYRKALREGWTVTKAQARNHLRWVPPDKNQPIVHSASSPNGGCRSVENTLGYLRKSGLDV